MSERTDPLSGFVLYKNEKEMIQVTIGKSYVRLSSDALRVVGNPDFVNIFFDDMNQRMAVKASDASMPNVFDVTPSSGIRKCGPLLDKILSISEQEQRSGEVIRFPGQKYGDYVIFDLKRPKKVNFDLHIQKLNDAKGKK